MTEPMETTPRRRKKDKDELWEKWDMRVLDTLIYALALAGAANQLFFTKEPNSILIGFCLSLLAVPALRKKDAERRAKEEKEKADEPKP